MRENLETPKERNIRIRAFRDASKYIDLMKAVSPESLEFQSDGKIIPNIVVAEDIFNEAKKSLDLDTEEMLAYMVYLIGVVESRLPH